MSWANKQNRTKPLVKELRHAVSRGVYPSLPLSINEKVLRRVM
jgi:hypothetical protein